MDLGAHWTLIETLQKRNYNQRPNDEHNSIHWRGEKEKDVVLFLLCNSVLSLFCTHSIDATELQRCEGDNDGEELPA